MFIRLRTQQSL